MDLAKLLNRKSPKKRPASNGPPARKKPALSEPPVEIVDLLGDDLLLASNVKTATHFQYGHPESYLYIYMSFFFIHIYTKAAVSLAYHSYGTRVAVQH